MINFLGYVGSKSFLEEVVNVLSDLREKNPNLVFGMELPILVGFLNIQHMLMVLRCCSL